MLFWASYHQAAVQQGHQLRLGFFFSFFVYDDYKAQVFGCPITLRDTYSVRKTYFKLAVEMPAPLSRVQEGVAHHTRGSCTAHEDRYERYASLEPLSAEALGSLNVTKCRSCLMLKL
jgi:hypothetical protein